MIPTYIIVTQWLTKQIDDKLNDIMHNTKNCQKTPLIQHTVWSEKNCTYMLMDIPGSPCMWMYLLHFFSSKPQYVGMYRTNRSTR